MIFKSIIFYIKLILPIKIALLTLSLFLISCQVLEPIVGRNLQSVSKTLVINISSAKKIYCRKGNQEEYIQIKVNENNSCKVIYIKKGLARTLASASSQTRYCFEVSSRLKKDLQEKNFYCREQ